MLFDYQAFKNKVISPWARRISQRALDKSLFAQISYITKVDKNKNMKVKHK